MFQSAVRFLAALVFTFVLLTYMWVNAAQAQVTYEVVRDGHPAEPVCRDVGYGGVVMCEGTPVLLQPAPRGTVRRLPAASAAHRAAAALAAHNRAVTGGRVGVTVVVARLGR